LKKQQRARAYDLAALLSTALYGKTPRGWLAVMQKKSGTGCGFAQATMVLAQEVLLEGLPRPVA
jgi:hypothetical protein